MHDVQVLRFDMSMACSSTCMLAAQIVIACAGLKQKLAHRTTAGRPTLAVSV